LPLSQNSSQIKKFYCLALTSPNKDDYPLPVHTKPLQGDKCKALAIVAQIRKWTHNLHKESRNVLWLQGLQVINLSNAELR